MRMITNLTPCNLVKHKFKDWLGSDAELLYLVRQETEDRSYDTLEFNEFLKMLGKHFLGPVTRDKLLEAFRWL